LLTNKRKMNVLTKVKNTHIIPYIPKYGIYEI
jgi:hypothetical protein